MVKPSDKKSPKKLKVNFEGVETRTLVPEGQHHVKVKEITVEDGEKAQYLAWVFEVMSDDKTNGTKLYTNTSLAPQALWNLRSLLETLGVETPDSEFNLDLPAYIDLEFTATVEHETYEGKTRARVTDYTPLDGTAESEDDEPAEATQTKGKAEETEDDEDSEEVETEEDGEEEEAETPKKGAKGKPTKITEDEVKEMDLEELKALLKKHSLKVKLDGLRASKQVAAVIDALEGASLLAD